MVVSEERIWARRCFWDPGGYSTVPCACLITAEIARQPRSKEKIQKDEDETECFENGI